MPTLTNGSQVQKQREERETTHFSACLDENIWEYEFKRLNKHKKKFLAPIILLGYFRDILRLGQVSWEIADVV